MRNFFRLAVRIIRTIILFSGLIFLNTCNTRHAGQYISLSGPTQGTSFHITYESADSTVYQAEIEELLHEFDMSLSTYQPASLISKINSNEGDFRTDNYFSDVFAASAKIYKESDGAFDITIAPVVNAWGFGFTERSEIDSNLIDSLLEYVGMPMVRMENDRLVKDKEGIMLDVNAIAQGYSVDVVAEFFESKGIINYLVEIGGEVRAKGKNGRGQIWRIGIDKPIDGLQIPGMQMQAIISLSDRALATSGNYRRFYEKDGIKYSHTISPETGYPVRHGLLSATVLADDCMTADAWATAFMVMGVEESKKILETQKGLDAYLIYNDDEGMYRVFYTPGLKKLIASD